MLKAIIWSIITSLWDNAKLILIARKGFKYLGPFTFEFVFPFLGYPSKWRFHKGVVCHENLPHAQHLNYHDLVLEADQNDDACSCLAGKVSRGKSLIHRVELR